MSVGGDWTFEWVSPQNTRYAIPCIDDRKVSMQLNGPTTVELKVPLFSDAGRFILSEGWGYVLVYWSGVFQYVTETISIDAGPPSSEGIPSIALVCSESGFQRLAGTLLTVSSLPYTFPTTSGPMLQRFHELLTSINGTGTANKVGVQSPPTTPSSPTITSASFEPSITFLALLQAYALRGSGFDFWISTFGVNFYPNAPSKAGPNNCVGTLMFDSMRGVNKRDVAFGYGEGTRGNLASYSWKRLAGDHLASAVYVPPAGTSADMSAGMVGAFAPGTSAGTVPLYYGKRERYVTADFDDRAARVELAATHIAYRADPRRILNITPHPSDNINPRPARDYGLGDRVAVKIVEPSPEAGQAPITIADGTLRIYGITITIDKDDMEKVELETTPEGVT